jgi:hypothetical protein
VRRGQVAVTDIANDERGLFLLLGLLAHSSRRSKRVVRARFLGDRGPFGDGFRGEGLIGWAIDVVFLHFTDVVIGEEVLDDLVEVVYAMFV